MARPHSLSIVNHPIPPANGVSDDRMLGFRGNIPENAETNDPQRDLIILKARTIRNPADGVKTRI
ncbi:MAG: hypothetical protein CMJ67_04145 [Planctomycetaceae bacterium]|nr:hypothetical protein [Planctomycetaceae bacterium]